MKSGAIGGIVAGVVVIVGLACTAICATRIPTGYDGVIYSMNGGVTGEVIGQGWHVLAPTKHVEKFTIANEQLLLTKDEREGSKGDDSFKVSTADDASIAISFQMSYLFIEEDLVKTFTKFRGMSGLEIVNNRVKPVLKSKVSEITTDYSMMNIYSGNRSEINDKLTKYLDKEFTEAYGIKVLDASIIDVHPDDELKEAINNRVKALQKKQQAQAEQETIRVEAETELIQAEADAKIKITEAEAEAEANRVKAESITDELIRMKEAEARLKHGWVTVQGADTVVTTPEKESK